MKNKAFTLIELLVVITILAILVGAALPHVQGYVTESRISKAKSDLETISKALMIYETRESTYKSGSLDQLAGRYLNNMPIDPWGQGYIVATGSGVVFTAGPDRIKDTPDDILANYQPPLALTQVKWVDANQSGAVDLQNTPDYLQMYFSRQVSDDSDAIQTPTDAHQYFLWTSPKDLDTALDWNTFVLDSSANLITISVATESAFGPGSDTIWIKDGAGLRDLAPNGGNMALASQTVIITSSK